MEGVRQQYRVSDPLKIRIETHQRYSEREVDFEAECAARLELRGHEALLDVGCGPGLALRRLCDGGHRGRLVGLDQSAGMAAEAAATGAAALVGDAQSLPFGDATFDRVVARHMLYHVPDVAAALREARRMLAPDGLFLASTNSRGNYPLMRELALDCARAFGWSDRLNRPVTEEHFSNEGAPAALGGVFGRVEPTIFENALMFTSAEPIARYMSSTFPTYGVDPDSAFGREALAWLRDEATRRIASMGGVWRDPKSAGIFVCRV